MEIVSETAAELRETGLMRRTHPFEAIVGIEGSFCAVQRAGEAMERP